MITDKLKQNWKTIIEFIFLGVLIYLVVIQNINIRCRNWCRDLTKPYLEYCSGFNFNLTDMNYTDFEEFMRTFDQNST